MPRPFILRFLTALRQFNSNMKDAFTGVVPQPANLNMGIAPPTAAPAPTLGHVSHLYDGKLRSPTIGSMITAVTERKQTK